MSDLLGIFGKHRSNIGAFPPDELGFVYRHRKRQQQPGGQIELRCPALGGGADEVIFKSTYSCQHWPCTRMVKLPHGVRVGEDGGGYCPHCNGLICAACMRLGQCLPLEEGVHRVEELGRLRERMSAEDMLRDMGYRAEAKRLGML